MNHTCEQLGVCNSLNCANHPAPKKTEKSVFEAHILPITSADWLEKLDQDTLAGII